MGRRTNFNEVKEIIQKELYESGSNLDNRRVWSYLTTSGILLRREDVRLALREMDPENVDKRQHRRLGRENIGTQVSVMYGILTVMINLSLMV